GIEQLDLEDNIYIAQHCFIDASRGLIIGEGCQICQYTSILTHSSHMAIRLYGENYAGSSKKGLIEGSVSIGKFTFVGPYSTIMPNAKIGKGSLVSSYSYVKGNFPDFSIISGNPAKVVGDTRKLDKRYLDRHPELLISYESWAHEDN
ncbi:MAG: acyltransferase, partial [Bacteroidota bacterium]